MVHKHEIMHLSLHISYMYDNLLIHVVTYVRIDSSFNDTAPGQAS